MATPLSFMISDMYKYMIGPDPNSKEQTYIIVR
jgi:hypothetical protein